MAITISYGCFACSRPANTSEAALLLAGAGEEFNGVLRICNQDSEIRTYSIAHCLATGAAGGAEWIAYEKELDPKDSNEWSVHLGNNQEIRIQASAADKLSFHYSGEKKVIS